MGGQEHFYLETQACLAVPKLEDGEMEIYASAQDPSKLQKTVNIICFFRTQFDVLCYDFLVFVDCTVAF